ncbi:Wzz/FepE/Etk N-terminal domain-containing protein [Neobacillus cucumis]|uniref:YveK family protein n=1 Tax=Neobacillus cucumis TaxID=1740721 RepID=UPI0020423E55|nr:Wzz/FepE/Etk N-terminal domain-containing protein [Neobacillus cucumis]MCM3724926.1 Wzz/FepE/Etk N-terminal domain-containing protein [Neobacillus cucumis]
MDNLQKMNRMNQRRPKEINLKELFLVIKRRSMIILLMTIIAGLAGYILNQSNVVPLYQSSSRVIIGADEESRKTLQVIVRDSSILDIVIKKMGLKETSDQLANKITVASLESSQVVSISVVDSNPIMASKIADTTAEVFKEEVPKIVDKDYIRILSKAKVNPEPINPKNDNKMFYGVIGGLVIGIGAAFFLETLDDRIRSSKEIEEFLGVPVVGRIPKITRWNKKKAASKTKLDVKMRGETVDYK